MPWSTQVEDIGHGHFGIAKLMIYRPTGEKVAVKFIERGEQVSAQFIACISLSRNIDVQATKPLSSQFCPSPGTSSGDTSQA